MSFAVASETVPAPPPAATARRADLEGLRVVAIFLVAAYHVWTTRVSGGVDVFLLLSGFFVGGSLWRQFVAGRPPRARAYAAKQVRRLVPTMIVVLAATIVALVVLAPRTRWLEGAEETLASLFYVENWWLTLNGQQYGAAEATTSPWQHFWSMSAQGQFFVLVPVLFALLWLVTRHRTERTREIAFLWLLVVATAASFLYAGYAVTVDQAAAYYSTPARLWEFLLGTLVAVLLRRWSPRGRLWPVVSWAGLLTLVLAGFVVDGKAAFPGPWTLVPLGAAIALIVSGAAPHGFGASRLLSLRWIAGCGKYTYAFYLWHWPILIFTSLYLGRETGWLAGIAILGTAGVLSVLTYHLVEQPLRSPRVVKERAPRSRWVALPLVTALGLFTVIAPVGWTASVAMRTAQAADSDDDFLTYPGALSVTSPEIYQVADGVEPIPAIDTVSTDFSQLVLDGCTVALDDSELADCSYVDGSGLRVALFGASHSEHWFEVALELAEENDWTLVPFVKPACVPALPEETVEGPCRDWLVSTYDAIESGGFDLVITTATRPGEDGDEVPSFYVSMLEKLSSITTVLGIRDNPGFAVDMPECYAMGGECGFPLSDYLSSPSPTDALDIPHVAYVDVNDLICPDGICSPVVGNRFVFRDQSHLTTTYMVSMQVEVAQRWSDALRDQLDFDVAERHPDGAGA
jgi:peptidoglycan/LPS O-acetylase OafA/YrhL